MWIRRTLCLVLLCGLPLLVLGAAKKEEPNPRGFSYIEMKPAFIVNVGGEGRTGFLKADVSLRVEAAATAAVEQHMPALRHQMIMMLSGQSADDLQSPEKREAMRVAALAAVQDIVRDSAQVEGVTDLLFTSFIVQR